MKASDIREHLFEMQDEEYRKFQIKLMPGVSEDSVIGVRTPLLRSFAKEVFKAGDYEEFLSEMPHKYYDEMNLHGFILCELKDYDRVVNELDRFLPHVNNWATCDLIRPNKAFKKNLGRLLGDIKRWIKSEDTYTCRFAIEMLMGYYLDEHFDSSYPEMVSQVESEEYYINMMRAWYFATALAKQWEATFPYIEGRVLDTWTHKKTIQKAIESYRISPEQKDILRKLR